MTEDRHSDPGMHVQIDQERGGGAPGVMHRDSPDAGGGDPGIIGAY